MDRPVKALRIQRRTQMDRVQPMTKIRIATTKLNALAMISEVIVGAASRMAADGTVAAFVGAAVTACAARKRTEFTCIRFVKFRRRRWLRIAETRQRVMRSRSVILCAGACKVGPV